MDNIRDNAIYESQIQQLRTEVSKLEDIIKTLKKSKKYLSWNDIDILVDNLVKQISSAPIKPKYITGLSRGGLIPAVLLSHKLDIPFISEHLINSLPSTIDLLIVDDIADTGETLNKYKNSLTAVLHYKFQSEHIPTYYASETNDEDWIIYPWEKYDAEPIQDYLK